MARGRPQRPQKNPMAVARAIDRHMMKAGLFVSPRAGIAANVARRLFGDHRVDRENGHWIALLCEDDQVARQAEAILLQSGYSGGPGGGSRRTCWVYAYDMTIFTREDR